MEHRLLDSRTKLPVHRTAGKGAAFLFRPFAKRLGAISGLGRWLAFCACSALPWASASAADAADRPAAEVLERAYGGVGGRTALAGLKTLTVASVRERYILGMGPEPGRGLFKATRSEAREWHDLSAGRLRLDYRHENLYGFTRDATELIVGDAGYTLGRDNFYYDTGAGVAMNPSRWATTIKTERLLNPYILLQETLADPTKASAPSNPVPPPLPQLGDDQIYPVTLHFGLVTGQRKLLVNQNWLDRWRTGRFKELVASELVVDADWLTAWRSDRRIEEAAHSRLIIQDEVSPITLHVHNESGRIGKLTALEHDILLGDVPLEVTYHDWRPVQGLALPMRIKLSIAGAPTLEVSRTEASINSPIPESRFAPPPNAPYAHDAELARRGARISQWLTGIAHGGSPGKPVGPLQVQPREIAPGTYIVFSTPDESARTLIVEQEQGFIVSDPGFLDNKGEALLAWMAEKSPGKPVSHVVATHHHVDHVGGIRPFIAAGAKLLCHAAAQAHYARHLSPRKATILPDALDRNPLPAQITGIAADEFLRLEDAVRPVTLYPVENRHVTDMLILHLDNEKLIYNGDLYSVTEEPDEPPGNGLDLLKGIERWGLQPKTIVGSHGPAPDVPFEAFKAHVTGLSGRPQVDVDVDLDAAVQQTAPSPAAREVPPSATRILKPGERIANYEQLRFQRPYLIQRLTERTYWLAVETYNAIVYVGDEGVLLIDPLSDGRGEIALQAIARITDLPVTAMLYSHSHLDHIGDGRKIAEAAQARGLKLRVIATSETLDEIKRFNKPVPMPNEVLPPKYGEFSFEDLRVTVDSSNGIRHSPDSSIIHLATEKVVHGVDFFVPGYIPFQDFDFALDLKAYEDSLDYLLELDWDFFNDGHGNIGSRADAQYVRTYVDDVKAATYRALSGVQDFTEYMQPDSSKNRFEQVLAFIEGPLYERVKADMEGKYGHHDLFERILKNHVFYIAVNLNMHGMRP